MHSSLRLTTFLAVALIAAGCGGSGAPTPAPGGPTVEMKEWQVIVTPATLKAGSNAITVRNTGSSAHDLTIIKTDKPADQLANDGAKVTEPAFANTASLNPGQTATVTVDLAAGKYVFICNQPGHYPLGMRTGVTVQ